MSDRRTLLELLLSQDSWLDPQHTIKKAKYIRSDNYQYIDTGIRASNSLHIKCVFQKVASSNNGLFGHTGVAGLISYSAGINVGTFKVYAFADNNIEPVLNDVGIDNVLELDGYNLTFNGTSYTLPDAGTVVSSMNIFLFALQNKVDPEYFGDWIMKSFEIVGQIKLQAAYNTTTQKYGMYDTINNQWYGDAGGGDFTGELE